MTQPLSFDWSLSARETPQAYDQYRDGMADNLCQVSDLAPELRGRFVNHTGLTMFSQGVVARGVSPGQTLTRTTADIRRSPMDAVMITRHAARTRADAGDHNVESGPGAIHLKDLTRTSAIWLEEVDLVNLMIPRETVPTWYLHGDHHGRVLGGQSGAQRLLGHHMQLLWEERRNLSDAEGGAAIQAMFIILRQILGEPARLGEEQQMALMRSIRARATQVIETSIIDPNMSTARLARDIGVSRSVLYRAFAADGGVARYVQRRRLEHAYQALARPMSRRNVGDVAERHGFVSQAHFSRAFRERFGHTPRDVPIATPEIVIGPQRTRGEMRYDAVAAWLRRA